MSDLWPPIVAFLVPLVVIPLLSVLLIRPSVSCPDCKETIRGWGWEGSDGGVTRWREHSRTSCPVWAKRKAELFGRPFP